MKFKKLVKIVFMSLLIIFMWNFCYAKYVYDFEEVIISLTREVEVPSYEISYFPNQITKEDVEIIIKTDKEIEQISGFTLSEDKKNAKRIVSENEEKTVLIRDLSGNYVEVKYSVDNIDKEPPQIIGCENGGTYDSPLELSYEDNYDIASIKIDKYDDELYVIGSKNRANPFELTIYIDKHPLNTVKYRYYINNELYSTIFDSKYTITSLNKEKDYEIKIEALDEEGNVLDSVILEEVRENYQKVEEPIDENNLSRKWKLSNCSNGYSWQ